MNLISRSILARSLMAGAASLALMTASAAGLRAEIVTVQGADGAAGDGWPQSGRSRPAGG